MRFWIYPLKTFKSLFAWLKQAEPGRNSPSRLSFCLAARVYSEYLFCQRFPRRSKLHITCGDVFAKVTSRSFCRGFFFAKNHARSPVRLKTPSRRLTAASSCGARLWLRRINRLANRRPPCQQILAVSCTAGARMCCKLFASSRVQLSPTNAENLFFMWLSQKRSHYILYDIVVFYCFMLICRAAFMAALCYCFV